MGNGDNDQTIGLIGLGLMGRGIGISLLRAGHRLGIVPHKKRDTAEELQRLGAWEAKDPATLAVGCDAIVLCLPSVDAAEQVVFGTHGITSGGRPGLLLVECSTLLPTVAGDFAARLSASHIDFVDAPVTRGPAEAVEGRLNALLGGHDEAATRAIFVLEAFCERVFRFGPPGSGYAAKLVNNFLAFSNLVAVAEAMATASPAGLDVRTLVDAIHASGGQNRVLDGLAPWLVDGSPTRSQVTLRTARKDASYYLQFAQSHGTDAALAREVLRSLDGALAAGLGDSLTREYVRHVVAGGKFKIQ